MLGKTTASCGGLHGVWETTAGVVDFTMLSMTTITDCSEVSQQQMCRLVCCRLKLVHYMEAVFPGIKPV